MKVMRYWRAPRERFLSTLPGAEIFDQTKHALSHATIHYISPSPGSRKTPMSISRYIVVAAVKFSWACSGLPVRR